MFCTIFSWHIIGVLSAYFQADISWKYTQILSTENHAKHCFKNEWTLVQSSSFGLLVHFWFHDNLNLHFSANWYLFLSLMICHEIVNQLNEQMLLPSRQWSHFLRDVFFVPGFLTLIIQAPSLINLCKPSFSVLSSLSYRFVFIYR